MQKTFILNRRILFSVFRCLLLLTALSCKNDDGSGAQLIVEPEIYELETVVEQNPSGIAPLTAYVTTEMVVAHTIDIVIKGKNDNDITHSFNKTKTSHKIPVLGLYADYNNKVIFTAKDDSGKILDEKTITILTPAIPEGELPQIDILQSNLAERYTFVEHRRMTETLPFIFDEQGEVRWYLKLPERGLNPVISHTPELFFVGHRDNPVYYYYNWLGEKEEEFTLAESDMFAHHSKTPHSDEGDIVLIDNEEFIGSLIYHFDASGNVIKEWNLNQIIRQYLPNDQDMVRDSIDWFHSNHVSYDATDDTILVSGRASIGIIKLDYDTGDVIWILGDIQRKWFQYPELQALALLPTGATEMPLGQHSPVVLPNGNIFLMDNGFDGYDRKADEDGLVDGGREYSRLVEYQIDEQAKTATQVLQYGKELGLELYARFAGSAGYDSISKSKFGIFGSIRESGTSQGDMPKIEGRIIEIDETGNLLFDAKVSSEVPTDFNFRTEKIEFYK